MKTNKQKTRCHVVGVKKLRRRQTEKEIKKQQERKKPFPRIHNRT